MIDFAKNSARLLAGGLVLASLSLAGCDSGDTPGEKLDEAIEEVGDELDDAGEKIKEGVEDAKESVRKK